MTVSELTTAASTSRNVFKVVLTLLSFIPGQTLPDNFPIRWLAAIAIVEFFVLTALEDATSLRSLICLVAILVISGGIYFFTYEYTGFEQRVDRGSKWWRLWGNGITTIRIMGGLWIRDDAKSDMQRRHLTAQGYLEGYAFALDKIWSRTSLVLGRILLITSYALMVLSASGILFLTGLYFAARQT